MAADDRVEANEGNAMFDVDFEDPKFQVGSKFSDANEFRLCMRQHNIVKNFNFRWNNSEKVAVKCVDKRCKWFMRASRLSDS